MLRRLNQKANKSGEFVDQFSENLDLSILYLSPIKSTRSGPIFNAHSYPTKISPESIALLIACHTKPGELIFDGFGGSGTTAIATLLCSNPSQEMIYEAEKKNLNPIWGARRAIVYELSGLGSFIGQSLCSRPNPEKFAIAAKSLLLECENKYGWIYEAVDENGIQGEARHYIWSDILECPSSGETISFWDGCVCLNPARIAQSVTFSGSGLTYHMGEINRVYESRFDELLGKQINTRKRKLVHVFGTTGKRNWHRPPIAADFELNSRINEVPIPDSAPVIPMMGKGGKHWGELWRAGYHDGITHVHHFYTRRNLIAVAALWKLINSQPKELRPVLRFWVSSYNTSHSTLMTRVVAKKNQQNLVLTSAQPGVLYVSGIPVEKNVFKGLKRKINTITKAFRTLEKTQGEVEVRQGTCLKTDLPDHSVDYVFTDPPFGGNIPYSEINFINEAWLGNGTCQKDEIVVSPSQNKQINDYEGLLTGAFQELGRILKPEGKVSLIFHSTQAKVWAALQNAYQRAGFQVELSNILDKKQGSFKQVTTKNFAKGDPILLLSKKANGATGKIMSPEELTITLLKEELGTEISIKIDPKRIYSRFVSYYMANNVSPPLNADKFYKMIAETG